VTLLATAFVFTWKEAVATSIAFVIIGGVTLYRFVIRPRQQDGGPGR
jgi:hypothetical protein